MCSRRWRRAGLPDTKVSTSCGLTALIPYHWTMLTNLKRDPFEQTFSDKSAKGCSGSIGCA
jgi:hypothetical protein